MKVKSLKLSRFQGRQNAYGCILIGFSFMLLTFLTIRLFAPEISTNAATQTTTATVGPNTISMSNGDAVSINIVPTSTPTVYSEKNTLSITNSCDAGATVTMTTNSTTSNKLTRAAVNSDTLTKDFNPATSTALLNGEWGYKVGTSATDWNAVPVKGSANPAVVYNTTAKTTSAETVDVIFGVKADNTIPSGAYTNDVIYTVAVKPACFEYSLTWDMNGGTAASGVTYPSSLSYGETIDLSQYTPTREGYTFTGWSDGSSVYTGVSDVNASELKAVKLTAVWSLISYVKNFGYTGGEQVWTAPYSGYYKLEVWGAQGGSASTFYHGGYGGYSTGIIGASKELSLYIVVGGKGIDGNSKVVQKYEGGYNGGGQAYVYGNKYVGSGGGATHIATVSGQMKSLASLKGSIVSNSYYISDKIFIVAGGGGGSAYEESSFYGIAGNGGGYIGTTSTHTYSGRLSGYGGTQVASPAVSMSEYIQGGFGYGAGASSDGQGAGGGWFGGNINNGATGGGGGSGYIGSSNLISGGGTTKHMTCYSCATSTAAATHTKSNTNVSSTATADYSKIGNGYARITYLGTSLD